MSPIRWFNFLRILFIAAFNANSLSFIFFNCKNSLFSAFFTIFGRAFNLKHAAKIVISHELQKKNRDLFRLNLELWHITGQFTKESSTSLILKQVEKIQYSPRN
nr:MAG TPA: hypothetical protein [Caudoviricetes sp.]